jgi:hypothetical protein
LQVMFQLGLDIFKLLRPFLVVLLDDDRHAC